MPPSSRILTAPPRYPDRHAHGLRVRFVPSCRLSTWRYLPGRAVRLACPEWARGGRYMASIGAVTLDGARIALGDETIDSLRKGLRGDLIRSHDDGYETTRR